MCIFRSKKVSTPDTSRQEEEARRQRELEEARWREQMEAEQRRWEADRADAERRYQEQLAQQLGEAERQRQAQEAEIARQIAAEQRAEALRQQEREETLAQQQQRAQQSREYSEGRQALITKAESDINAAYAGFDDDFFNTFAQQFTAQHMPELERQAADKSRATTMAAARKGNLKSSASARQFGELAQEKSAAQAQLAGQGADAAQQFRSNIDGQRRDALSAIWSAGGVGSEVLPDGVTDVAGALGGIGAQLGSLTQTARNRAGSINNSFF